MLRMELGLVRLVETQRAYRLSGTRGERTADRIRVARKLLNAQCGAFNMRRVP